MTVTEEDLEYLAKIVNIPAITNLVGEIRCEIFELPTGMKEEIGEIHQSFEARFELREIRTHTYLEIRPLKG